MCKVGIPINSINKYIEKLDKTGYSYIILDYDKEKSKIIKKFEQYYKKMNAINIVNMSAILLPNLLTMCLFINSITF